eukprot:6321682-Prymnesium_polylepis.2
MGFVLRMIPEQEVVTYVGLVEGVRALGALSGPVLGGWLFEGCGYVVPFVVPACAFCVAFAAVTAITSASPSLGGGKDAPRANSAEQLAFVQKPPVVGLLLLTCAVMLPIAFSEPSFEPFLTAEPFNLTPGQVGTFFGVMAICDVLGAVLTGGRPQRRERRSPRGAWCTRTQTTHTDVCARTNRERERERRRTQRKGGCARHPSAARAPRVRFPCADPRPHAGPLAKVTGAFPILYGAPCTLAGAILFMAFGPRHLVAVGASFAFSSFSTFPSLIVMNQMMLRVCRTYDLDPKVQIRPSTVVRCPAAPRTPSPIVQISRAALMSLAFGRCT